MTVLRVMNIGAVFINSPTSFKVRHTHTGLHTNYVTKMTFTIVYTKTDGSK